jgi:hypothetical protein
MVRQDADSICCERQAHLNRTINLPQVLDMLDKQRAGPVKKRNGEKEYPAFDSWAPISRHQQNMAREADGVRKIAPTLCRVRAPRRAILHTLRGFGQI